MMPVIIYKGAENAHKSLLNIHGKVGWKNGYLVETHKRFRDFKVGDTFLTLSADTSHIKWKLGQILELYPDNGGHAKVEMEMEMNLLDSLQNYVT